jgi:anti-sigma factor RsiW
MLFDGEIAGSARRETEVHAASCAICGAMLRHFGELRTALSMLDEAPAAVDIAALVDNRLPPRPAAHPVRQRQGWRWEFLPVGLVGAGVLATGAYLGMLLGAGATVGVTRPAAMAVFDAVPPGGLCLPPVCYRQGK